MPAAVTDAYATAAEYRLAVDKDSAAEDAEILTDLTAVSRYLERRLDQFFTQDASAVARLYDGNGEKRLYLDSHSLVPGVASVTGLTVKVDLNADYDVTDTGETLTKDTHFWLGPWDTDKGSEARPWTFMEIVPTNSALSAWPKQLRSVEVTAIFGWPAVPQTIKRGCIELTAILRLETPRAKRSVSETGEILEASREARTIVDRLIEQYGKMVLL